MRPLLPLALISEILVISQLAAANELPLAASPHRQDSTSPSTSTSTSASPTLSPTSITLWDVGFSLWQGWEDMRDDECPVPPDLAAAEMTEPDPPTEAVEADFVSFEEWKRIKEAEDEGPDARSNASDSVPAPVEQEAVDTEVSPPNTEHNETKVKPPSAHVHSRYNYASPDCSARIHSASPLTQHASSLLHKSRDRYMLTPCKTDEHWVVIELCDEIRIEAIELAVWEFFSGVVREVKVSVGEEDEVDSGEWVEVGAFVGKNVRGAQTFVLPQPTSFHRFVRLEFPSYYGTEYYCPVSHVKVFGMNQMEAFKWEQKKSNAKEQEKPAPLPPRAVEKDVEADRRHEEERAAELRQLERLVQAQARRIPEPDVIEVVSAVTTGSRETRPATPSSSANASSNTSTTSNYTAAASNASESVNATTIRPPRSESSESIYALIVRRLNALEGNSSLVARYIEEQSRTMRTMLEKAEKGWDEWRNEREGEERGRWEQERMRQEDRLGRVASQVEQQRVAMDKIQSQLRVLADELSYERRRGLAQLVILLVIIALGVASRSSTIDAVLKPLVAEARRRRSFYAKKSLSGPLAGLRIDMGAGRPPAVIGESRREEAPTPTRSKPLSRANSGRAGTPRPRKVPPAPTFRSFSAADFPPGPTSPRSKLASRPAGAPRRLARSAHLHTIEADKVREKARQDLRNDAASVQDDSVSPTSQVEDVLPSPLTFDEDWGTDGEVSASEVDTSELDYRDQSRTIWK